ncbi:hypothetical protein C3L33_00310, partial [Rhododendron williamsianum]
MSSADIVFRGRMGFCDLRSGVGGPNKDFIFYGSFTHGGVEYFLYDCVYMWRDNELDIGKIVKIWETPSHSKKVKVEAICGKCNVVCTSKDKRNPQPSKEDLRMADYIFNRTFDVARCTISPIFPDVIAESEAKVKANELRSPGELQADFPALSYGKKAKSSLHQKVVQLEREDCKPKFSWMEKLKSAYERGTLVLLENLDPSYTSSEVEDIVWSAFKEMGEAKMYRIAHRPVLTMDFSQGFVLVALDSADLLLVAKDV